MNPPHLKGEILQTMELDGTGTKYENKISYDQGPEAGQMQFILICEQVPMGTIVGFSSDEPGPVPPINLPPTVVTASPSFTIGLMSEVPANYKCIITYYADFKTPPPPGVKITFMVARVID